MHQYTIYDGKMIGDFEGLYKNFKDPFIQTKKEKFETSKKIIINYCQLLQSKRNKVLKTLQENTHKCNKCGGSYMRIWRLNELDIELRCESCKKKYLYNQDFYRGINLYHFLGDIHLLKERYRLQNSNPMLRQLDFKFDFQEKRIFHLHLVYNNFCRKDSIFLNHYYNSKKRNLKIK